MTDAQAARDAQELRVELVKSSLISLTAVIDDHVAQLRESFRWQRERTEGLDVRVRELEKAMAVADQLGATIDKLTAAVDSLKSSVARQQVGTARLLAIASVAGAAAGWALPMLVAKVFGE